MKAPFVLRAVSFALLAALLLAGYRLGGVPEQPQEEGEKQYMLVDSLSGTRTQQSPSGGEMPPITSEPLAAGQTAQVAPVSAPAASVVKTAPAEVRSVWISYLEMNTLLTGKTESQFRSGIQEVFDNSKDFGLNTVVVQVRPFGDALYASNYFPWSYIAAGEEGQAPGFDPLSVMVEEAAARGLRIEAWVNPYRIRAAGSTKELHSSNPAYRWLQTGHSAVIEYNGTISYNPASKEAQALIVNGVRELVRNYNIDAVHIDDYFYPTTDAAFDKEFYDGYRANGGSATLADWRRANVEALVRQMYAAIKEEDPQVLFGISPQSNIDTNYNVQYLDVEKVAANPGYCDYICPQIYFGFENDVQPYAETLAKWSALVKGSEVELYVGLGAYKAGGPDSWAGSGAAEWQQNKDLLGRMVEEARGTEGCTGFVLYRYDSLFNPAAGVSGHVEQEAANLKKLL